MNERNPDHEVNPNDGQPTDPKEWPRNPRPQEELYDKPGKGNETFISQLVCQSGGQVYFQWQWSADDQGQRRKFPEE